MDLHGATNFTPLGATRYTAYMTDELYSDGSGLVAAGRSAGKSIPPYLIRGVVRDDRNQPVFGAAIIVDRQQIFTDSDGVFVLRKKKGGEYDLKVDLANFLFPEKFDVVSAPAKVKATLAKTGDRPVVVTISRSNKASQPL